MGLIIMNQEHKTNKKRTFLFFILGLLVVTLSLFFNQKILVAAGGMIFGTSLAHFFLPYRSPMYHFFVFIMSLATVFMYIFFVTYLLWGRLTLP